MVGSIPSNIPSLLHADWPGGFDVTGITTIGPMRANGAGAWV